jgi:hypothetical protein
MRNHMDLAIKDKIPCLCDLFVHDIALLIEKIGQDISFRN